MKGYADLANLSEDERIAAIVHQVRDHLRTVAVCVDDVPGKPERYVRKLRNAYPNIRIIDRFKGPVPNVVTIRVGPPTS